MAIDVFFTGLMLICLDGNANCPTAKSGQNTAYVIQADGIRKPCGRDSCEETELYVRYSLAEVLVPVNHLTCYPDNVDHQLMWCRLQDHRYCVVDEGHWYAQVRTSDLNLIPRLDEVDSRFTALNLSRLSDDTYVPQQIYFPHGRIGAGPSWQSPDPKDNYYNVPWYRSNGVNDRLLPRELSDRLMVTYSKAYEISVTDCDRYTYLKVKAPEVAIPEAPPPSITFANSSAAPLSPDKDGDHYNLSYLLWYYDMAWWETYDGVCHYHQRDEAIVQSCWKVNKDYSCSNRPDVQRDTDEWPPYTLDEPLLPQ